MSFRGSFVESLDSLEGAQAEVYAGDLIQSQRVDSAGEGQLMEQSGVFTEGEEEDVHVDEMDDGEADEMRRSMRMSVGIQEGDYGDEGDEVDAMPASGHVSGNFGTQWQANHSQNFGMQDSPQSVNSGSIMGGLAKAVMNENTGPRRRHQRNSTFGQQDFYSSTNTAKQAGYEEQPDHGTQEDPEELQVETQAMGDDFDFIDEILTSHIRDMAEKTPIHEVIAQALKLSGKKKKQLLQETAQDVQAQADNFKKTIEYAGYLLENARKKQKDQTDQRNDNDRARMEMRLMEEQMNAIRDEWRGEQQTVVRLEEELNRKDAQIRMLHSQNLRSQNLIETLEKTAEEAESTIVSPSKRKNSSDKRQEDDSRLNFNLLKKNEDDEEHKKRLNEMETLLLKKQDDLDTEIHNNEYMKKQIGEMREFNMEQQQDLDDAQEAIDEQDARILELETLVESLGGELQEQEALVRQVNQEKIEAQMKLLQGIGVDDMTSQGTSYHPMSSLNKAKNANRRPTLENTPNQEQESQYDVTSQISHLTKDTRVGGHLNGKFVTNASMVSSNQFVNVNAMTAQSYAERRYTANQPSLIQLRGKSPNNAINEQSMQQETDRQYVQFKNNFNRVSGSLDQTMPQKDLFAQIKRMKAEAEGESAAAGLNETTVTQMVSVAEEEQDESQPMKNSEIQTREKLDKQLGDDFSQMPVSEYGNTSAVNITLDKSNRRYDSKSPARIVVNTLDENELQQLDNRSQITANDLHQFENRSQITANELQQFEDRSQYQHEHDGVSHSYSIIGSQINPSEFNDAASQYTAYKEKKMMTSKKSTTSVLKFRKRAAETKEKFKNLDTSYRQPVMRQSSRNTTLDFSRHMDDESINLGQNGNLTPKQKPRTPATKNIIDYSSQTIRISHENGFSKYLDSASAAQPKERGFSKYFQVEQSTEFQKAQQSHQQIYNSTTNVNNYGMKNADNDGDRSPVMRNLEQSMFEKLDNNTQEQSQVDESFGSKLQKSQTIKIVSQPQDSMGNKLQKSHAAGIDLTQQKSLQIDLDVERFSPPKVNKQRKPQGKLTTIQLANIARINDMRRSESHQALDAIIEEDVQVTKDGPQQLKSKTYTLNPKIITQNPKSSFAKNSKIKELSDHQSDTDQFVSQQDQRETARLGPESSQKSHQEHSDNVGDKHGYDYESTRFSPLMQSSKRRSTIRRESSKIVITTMKQDEQKCQNCAGRDTNMSTSSDASNGLSKWKQARAKGQRKDPEQEFFGMTFLGKIMSHEKKNLLIEMQMNQQNLYKRCKSTKRPFYEWSIWIDDQIKSNLLEQRNKRLLQISKEQEKKQQGKLLSATDKKK